MALIDCQDCGNRVSEAATACPKCGRPVGRSTNSCPRCREGELVTGTGLHGVLEVLTTIIWTVSTIVIGLVLYFYLSSRPYCPACKRRPVGTVSPVSLAVLAILGLLPLSAMWALITSGPRDRAALRSAIAEMADQDVRRSAGQGPSTAAING